MWETLTNDPANQLTGDVTVALSAIPTEYLYDTETQSIGYTYTYFSSSAEVLRVATSSTYSVTFSLPVSQYFYQIKNVQAISDVVFLTVLRVLFLLLALSSPILSPIVTTAGQTTPQVVAHPLRPPIRTTLCPLFNSQSSLCGSGAHPPWCLVVCCCFSVVVVARVFYPQLCGKQATFFFPLYHSSRKFVSSPPYNAANESLMKKNQQRDFLEFISSPEYQTPFSFTLLAITPLVSPYLPLSPSLLLLASHISCLPLSSSSPFPLILLFSSL